MKFWTQTDPFGNTAHHLAAETSNMAVLQVSQDTSYWLSMHAEYIIHLI